MLFDADLVLVFIELVLHVAERENCSQDFPDVVELLLGEAKGAHASHRDAIVRSVVNAFSICTIFQESVVFGVRGGQLVLLSDLSSCKPLIKDVETSLPWGHRHCASLLKKEGEDLHVADLASLGVNERLDELAEARRVDVWHRLCVTERFHHGVRVQDALLHHLVLTGILVSRLTRSV